MLQGIVDREVDDYRPWRNKDNPTMKKALLGVLVVAALIIGYWMGRLGGDSNPAPETQTSQIELDGHSSVPLDNIDLDPETIKFADELDLDAELPAAQVDGGETDYQFADYDDFENNDGHDKDPLSYDSGELFFESDFDTSTREKHICKADVLNYRRPPAFFPPPFNLSCPWLFESDYTPYVSSGDSPTAHLCTQLVSLVHDVVYSKLNILYNLIDGPMLAAYRNAGHSEDDPDIDIRLWLPDVDENFVKQCGSVPSERSRVSVLTSMLNEAAEHDGIQIMGLYFEDDAPQDQPVWRAMRDDVTCDAHLTLSSAGEDKFILDEKPCTCPYGDGLALCPTPALAMIEKQYGPTWFYPIRDFKGYNDPDDWQSGLASPLDEDSEIGQIYRTNVRDSVMQADLDQDGEISAQEIQEKLMEASVMHQDALEKLPEDVWQHRADALNELIKALDWQEKSLSSE